MNRFLPWMLLALVALAIVAWFVDRGPRLQVAPTAVAYAPGERNGAEVFAASRPESSPEAAQNVADGSRAPVLHAPKEQQEEVSPHAGLWIEVVFADNGAPAVGAEVQADFFVQRNLERESRGWEAARRLNPRVPAARSAMLLPWPEEQVGKPLVTDAKGRVRLLEMGSRGELRASARRGGVPYRGELELSPHEIAGPVKTMRLELFPAFEGMVLVLDSEGAPVADVAVAAIALAEFEPRTHTNVMGHTSTLLDWPSEPRMLAGGVTDGDGWARLFDPSNNVARAFAAGVPVGVEALVVSDPPVRVGLVPEQPTVLRLPPMGSVVVELAQGSQAQVHDFARVGISIQGQPDFPELHRFLDRGRTRFAHVGLGLRLTAEFQTLEHNGPFRLDGPTTAGEEARFVLPKVLGIRVVQFQLVDGAGVPLADTWVRVFHGSDKSLHLSSQRTDPTGRMRLECGSSWAKYLYLELQASGKEREGSLLRSLGARVDLGLSEPLPAHAPFHDAGTLVLRPMPILAMGRVLDGSGSAVPGATVAVDRFLWDPSYAALMGPRGVWTQTNLRGEFLIEGEIPAPDAFLFAIAGGFGFSVHTPLVPGERDIELVLQSTGTVRLTLLLPAGLDPGPATVRIVQGNTRPLELDPSPSVGDSPAGRMTLQRDGLKPGLWTVEVLSVADPVPLWRRDFEVPAAGTADLGELDFTQRFPVLEVRASGENGEPVSKILVSTPRGDRSIGPYRGDAVPLLMPKPPDGTMLDLSADGFAPLRVTVDGPVLEVVLATAPAAPLGNSGIEDGQ